MTKDEHISYWLTNAERDWQRAERCFNDSDYVFCLFCVHLSLEKICKAIWVKYNEPDYPPKIHNLVKLLERTPLNMSEDDLIFLNDMNKFQLEGRYPDYKEAIYKDCTLEFTRNIFDNAKQIKTCLTKKLQ